MTWVIVAVVAAILVANLLKLLPRGRMLHIQRLREAARKLGYRVERQPETAAGAQLEHCVGYRQSLERCSVQQEFSCERDGQGWRWLLGSADNALALAVLDTLPQAVQRIDRQSFSVLVFWIEPDSIATLEQLDLALAPLRQSQAG
ncbi:hypothetical protein [Halopseudomonas salina]|uniref:hypothetical protein n=1 Tax=Halopseudomonas salina TaxID=1323744 RepID=UPI001239B25B|nr:hypothetical protein [Halopseudomonas salina]